MLFFGGKNGFNAFYPEEIKPNPNSSKVIISDLKLFNKSVSVGDEINDQKILKAPIFLTHTLELEYKNNIVTIEFSALHFAQPDLINYAYYLEGFEESWNYVGKVRTTTYTNLEPGNYTFRAKATNNDGIWSDNEVALNIIVKPPWWKSLFIKLISPVVVLFLILFIFRIRVKILKDQKKKNISISGFSLDDLFLIIAEDEPTNYEVLIKMLNIQSGKHFWGTNGKEVVDFIEKLDKHENIMVLMDIKMPVMDGHEALKRIKKIDPKIPVIALTAYAMKIEETKFLSEGFDAYISKPINKEKAKQVIASFY